MYWRFGRDEPMQLLLETWISRGPPVSFGTKMNQAKLGSKLWNLPCSNMFIMFITQVNHLGLKMVHTARSHRVFIILYDFPQFHLSTNLLCYLCWGIPSFGQNVTK